MPNGINGGLQSALRATSSARARQFIELDQSDLGRPVLCAKIFWFTFDPNHLHISRHPGPHKGAFRDRHERRVGMRWTRVALKTRAQSCGRRSRVVLTPRRWRQVGGRHFRQRWWQTSPVTKESAKETVKTIAQEMPGVPV